MISRSVRTNLFVLFLAVLVAATVAVFIRGVSVETDILKLIPSMKSSHYSEIVDQFSRNQTGEVIWMVSSSTDSLAVHIAKKVESLVKSQDFFRSVQGSISPIDQKAWFDLYFPARYTNLSSGFRAELLSNDPSNALICHVQRTLYSPAPDYYGATMELDPLSLFPDFIMRQINGETEMCDGFAVFRSESTYSVMLTATLKGSPFDQTVQRKTESLTREIKGFAIQNLPPNLSGKPKRRCRLSDHYRFLQFSSCSCSPFARSNYWQLDLYRFL